MGSLIEPSSFDLIVLGTGLPQCIIAAAAASTGHSVLHLDSCDFYGSHWASLPLQDFTDWCRSTGQLPFPASLEVPQRADAHDDVALAPVDPFSPACIESLDDPGLNANDQAKDAPQIQTESLDMESKDFVVREGAQCKVENPTPTSEEDDTETPRQVPLCTVDADGSCSSSEASLRTDATDPQRFASNDSNTSFPGTSIEETALELVSIERDACMYRSFHFTQSSMEILGRSRSYYIDIAGPKLAFCGGRLVDLLLRSGANNYLEFKDLESSFMWSTHGLSPVPSSRADVFKDRSLTNAEKRHLMRFFKLVADHISLNAEISQGDMESPFIEFLQGRQVPSSVQAMILYAIALSNHEQNPIGNGQCSIMSTKEGVERLALYLTSVGRFANANGAFLYSLYGQGELPQAFSRCAAVKGALYALKMPIRALLRDKRTREFKGVQMESNQRIFSGKLVAGPSMYSTLCNSFACETSLENGGAMHECDQHEESLKVVRSICITDKSLKPDLSTFLVVFPPQSFTSKEGGVIRALQLGSSVYVCPEGKFLVQLSMACSNESVGIEALQAAMQSLFHFQDSNTVAVEDKPTLLWAVSYVHAGIYPQGAKWISAGRMAVCGMPDETLDYEAVVTSAEMVFKGLYPEDAFFVGTPPLAEENTEVHEDVTDTDTNAAGTIGM